MRRPRWIPFLLWLVVGFAAAVATAQDVERISTFGRYEGYSVERFDGWTTTSRYLAMRDGVRLAIDVTRPTKAGAVVEEPLPVVWTHSRYHRNPRELVRVFSDGTDTPEIRSMVDARADLQRLVRHGYVFAAVGVRGSGASFGRYDGLFSAAETQDAVEVIAWLAVQPWSDGNVGMWGSSYLGITQYMAASRAPPALKAIFPDVAAFDLYDFLYPGGVFREDMIRHWDDLTVKLDREWPAPAVDGDDDGSMLRRAMAEHADNWQVLASYSAAGFRDDATPALTWSDHGPSRHLEAINAARVPAYHFNAWFDVFVTDACLWYANYLGPQKLAIGAWAHGGVPDAALMAERARLTMIEQHRWFDRWLKGIENGVEDEPPVHFAVMEEPGRWRWRASASWPPPEAEPVPMWFVPAGAGRLVRERPADAGADAYAIDPTTTTGATSRWDNAVGAAPVMLYEGLAENDRKALTYTTAVLDEDVVVAGHPIVTLFVTATHGDADFHVLLEEVDEAGAVRYVTEGVLRGSQRRLAAAPWNNLGLPYQRCFAEDRDPLPSDLPTAVVLDLHPTANVFDAGHRIRIAILCADADNTRSAPVEPGAAIRVFVGGEHASGVVLPILR